MILRFSILKNWEFVGFKNVKKSLTFDFLATKKLSKFANIGCWRFYVWILLQDITSKHFEHLYHSAEEIRGLTLKWLGRFSLLKAKLSTLILVKALKSSGINITGWDICANSRTVWLIPHINTESRGSEALKKR